MIRLVATDLDGTLLRSDRSVSERTRLVLDRAQAAGVTVVLVTARPPRGAALVADAAGLSGPAICANGASVYDLDAERIVEHRPLASEVAARLVHGLREAAPGITFAVERELAFSREAAFELNPEWPVPEHDVHADALTLIALPATKLVLRHPAMPHAQLLALATALAGADASVTHSSEAIVEISATGANKAAALAELCRDLDVPSEAVVAFGDMPNDLAMLRFAGLGVAVANGHPDVLDVADEITAANDEDGVALVLERLLEAGSRLQIEQQRNSA